MRDVSENPAQNRKEVLRNLAVRVNRLCPDRRDPEAFHVEKDDIARQLARLAGKVAA